MCAPQHLLICLAKWEERDSRWIVEERKDGANVNAWHWQETSRLAWSKQRLAELLTGLAAEVDPSLGHARVTGVKDLSGEAYVAVRKGNKKLAVYDLTLVLTWAGRWEVEGQEVKGEIRVAEFALANEPDEYDFACTADAAAGSADAQANLREAMAAQRGKLFALLGQYVAELGEL